MLLPVSETIPPVRYPENAACQFQRWPIDNIVTIQACHLPSCKNVTTPLQITECLSDLAHGWRE